MTFQSFRNSVLLFMALVFSSSFIQAQSNTATIWTDNTSSKEIKINYQLWLSGIIQDSETGQEYAVGDIKEMHYENAVYVPHNLDITFQTNTVDGYLPTRVVSDTTVLLRKIVEGSMGFYAHRDPEGNFHHFVRKEGVMHELVKEKTRLEDGSKVIRDKYKGILKVLLSDCDAIDIMSIDRKIYNEGTFKKYIIKYNEECGTLEYVAKSAKFRIHGGPIVSYIRNSSSFEGNSSETFMQHMITIGSLDYSSYQIGGFVQVPLFRWKGYTSIVFEALFNNSISYDFEGGRAKTEYLRYHIHRY